MCGLCGVIGSEGDWTEAPGAPIANTGATRRAQRLHRVRVVNLVLAQFGLSLSDWQGTKFQLSSRTGRTEVIDNLSQVWLAAEHILGRPCDPLDPSVLSRLGQGERTSSERTS